MEKTVATGKMWKADDYKVLANAWVNASVVTEGHSSGKFFYQRVNDLYNGDPECVTRRSIESTKTAWYNVNTMCTKYKGIKALTGIRLEAVKHSEI